MPLRVFTKSPAADCGCQKGCLNLHTFTIAGYGIPLIVGGSRNKSARKVTNWSELTPKLPNRRIEGSLDLERGDLMGSLLRATRRRLFRVAGARLLALVAAAFLLIPHFACHCADGRVKPLCVPGHCDRMCGSSDSKSASCCSEKPCCGAHAADSKATQGSPAESTASTVPCCTLVVDAPAVVIVPVTVDAPPVPVAVAWVIDRPVDMEGLAANQLRHAPVDSLHPPDDIVIRQLRITI